MIIEMGMESVFVVADIFFVSRLEANAVDAVAAVGLTELSLTFIYSVAMGVSMGATALVARRVGEKDEKGASIAGVQAIYIGLFFAAIFTIIGIVWAGDIIRLLGADDKVVAVGTNFTRVMFCGNIVIMMLFLI